MSKCITSSININESSGNTRVPRRTALIKQERLHLPFLITEYSPLAFDTHGPQSQATLYAYSTLYSS